MLKLFFSFVLFFYGYSALCQTTWSDLELNQKYELKVSIPIDENNSLKKDQVFRLDYFEPADHFFYYLFKNLNCTDASLTSEMIIFEGLGIEIEKDCNLGVYIEPFNYYDVSVF